MMSVLVLEDEPAVMKLLRHMLTGYNVIEARTAEEALMLFIDHDYRVDLLIADLTIAKRSGIQVALLFRSKLPSLPVIVTSGSPVSDWSAQKLADLDRLGRASVTIVQKPFQADDLSDAVRSMIGAAPSRSATQPQTSMPSWL